MILLIDNYDSFTYNLKHQLEAYADVQLVRNDAMTVDELLKLKPEAVVISPGPGRPESAGVLLDYLKAVDADLPILGVCLGHQAMIQALGGQIVSAPTIVHGKSAAVFHASTGLFANCRLPFKATRYHSLVAEAQSLPEDFQVTAETADGVIMAVKHKTRPLYGVQFHPESILTECGDEMIRSFVKLAGVKNAH